MNRSSRLEKRYVRDCRNRWEAVSGRSRGDDSGWKPARRCRCASKIIGEAKGKKPIVLLPPKFLINSLAKMGDMISLPINSKRLKKMTSNLIVSNQKIKTALNIDSLPISAEEGMKKTIESFILDKK